MWWSGPSKINQHGKHTLDFYCQQKNNNQQPIQIFVVNFVLDCFLKKYIYIYFTQETIYWWWTRFGASKLKCLNFDHKGSLNCVCPTVPQNVLWFKQLQRTLNVSSMTFERCCQICCQGRFFFSSQTRCVDTTHKQSPGIGQASAATPLPHCSPDCFTKTHTRTHETVERRKMRMPKGCGSPVCDGGNVIPP